MRAVPVLAVCTVLSGAPLAAQQAQPLLTWAYVEAVDGTNILLDDGSILRLGAQSAIRKADGSAGTTNELERGAKIVFRVPGNGTVESVQVFPPRGPQEAYLYDLPTERGAASGTALPADGRLWPKCIATTAAGYQRSKQWERFEARVLYEPAKVDDAPSKALFAVLDDLGVPLFEVALSAGEMADVSLGFGAQSAERIALHARPVGDGDLRQEWCWWLDPHFIGFPTAAVRWTVSLSTVEALMQALGPAAAAEKAGKVAVTMFDAARGFDEYALRDLQDDLFIAVGRKGSVAAKYAGRLKIGEPVSDKDRDQLKKLGATSALLGSVTQRSEGAIINAALVNVDSGAILATATARQ